MANSIITVFPEADLRNGHPGLRMLAAKRRIDTQMIEPGKFVMFLNRRQSAFKLFAANNTIVHYKHPRGRILLETIKHFPECFQAGEFRYDKALEKVLSRRLRE